MLAYAMQWAWTVPTIVIGWFLRKFANIEKRQNETENRCTSLETLQDVMLRRDEANEVKLDKRMDDLRDHIDLLIKEK